MRSFARLGGLVLFVCLAKGARADTPYPHIAPSEAKSPEEERQTFKLPAGFEVQLVASEPEIHKPIQIAFDARGRLWATTSEEYPFAARGRPGKDRVYVLEDFGPGGKARKVSVFADDLNIPIGVLPLPDGKSALVTSIDPLPDASGQLKCWIWKLTDTDGDGKCDKKEKLYGPFGCDDTHGMNNTYTLMPDGWVYACHGFKNDSKPQGTDGQEVAMNSGNTFRFRPDGSHIEIWTRGQVNPFGIAVDPFFDLYTADCHSRPITQLIPHATYQSFSKPHDGLGFAPHVTIHGHDSTALCGLVYYAAEHFPREYQDHMFLGNVTSNCINYDKIEFRGSTPVGVDKGMFLSSSDRWFRPTDIKLGPDGALYFADFYNRIIGHYEVDLKHPGRDRSRGRIWRVVYRGADGKNEIPKIVDLTGCDRGDLHQAMGSGNLARRLLAFHEWNRRFPLENSSSDKSAFTPTSDAGFADQLAGTTLETWRWFFRNPPRDQVSPKREALAAVVGKGLTGRSPFEQVQILRMAAAWEAWPGRGEEPGRLRDVVIPYLQVAQPRVQRAAVEALILHPDPANVRPLLDLLPRVAGDDGHLRYAILVALRDSLTQLPDWSVVKANDRQPAEVDTLAEVALAAPTAAAARFLADHFGNLQGAAHLSLYIEHAARYGDKPEQTLQFIQKLQNVELVRAIRLLQAYQQGTLKRLGRFADSNAIAMAGDFCDRGLVSGDAATVQAAIDLAAALKLPAAAGLLSKLVMDGRAGESQRASALAALAGIDPAGAGALATSTLNDSAASFVLRERAAHVLAALNRSEAFDELVKSLQSAPGRLQMVIAMAMADGPNGAERLLQAVEAGKASARLLQDRTLQTKLNERRLPRFGERLGALTRGLPSADDRLLQLIAARRDGFAKAAPDPVLGKQVFAKNCAACHQIANEGAKIGPQLDGIGGRGLERLLEDVLDPNRNVDAAFRTTTVALNDGRTIGGLLLREEGQVLVMADDKGKEVRLPLGDIESRRQSLLSPMPANLSEAIAEKDFHDLMAYLLAQRAKQK